MLLATDPLSFSVELHGIVVVNVLAIGCCLLGLVVPLKVIHRVHVVHAGATQVTSAIVVVVASKLTVIVAHPIIATPTSATTSPIAASIAASKVVSTAELGTIASK